MTTIELVTVTPAIAEQWLTHVDVQRKLMDHVVAGYATDMLAGRWTTDSNAICFDQAGHLINGQHRLHAVISSGCTITFAVMRGVDGDAILHMDQGAKRKTADQLYILGIPNAVRAAAIARLYLLYRGMPGKVWTGIGSINKIATQAAQVQFVQQHAELMHAATTATHGLHRHRFNLVTMGLLYVLIEQDSNNSVMREPFLDGLLTGAGLHIGDPRLALRDYYARPGLTAWGGSQSHVLATIRAWNKYVRDEDLRLLKTPRRDELPMPKVL